MCIQRDARGEGVSAWKLLEVLIDCGCSSPSWCYLQSSPPHPGGQWHARTSRSYRLGDVAHFDITDKKKKSGAVKSNFKAGIVKIEALTPNSPPPHSLLLLPPLCPTSYLCLIKRFLGEKGQWTRDGTVKKSDGRLVNGEDKAGCKMKNGEIDGSNRSIWKCPFRI